MMRGAVRRCGTNALSTLASAFVAFTLPDPYRVEQLAPGVFAVIREVPTRNVSDSNVLFIINDNDVVVVDANIFPASARQTIAEIKKRTNKPVQYVVNTHWHSDHHYGNGEFRKAYPGVEFISHPHTREQILTEDIPDFRKNVSTEYPAEIKRFEQSLASGKRSDGTTLTPEGREAVKERIALYRFFLNDVKGLEPIAATITVADSLVLQRGARSIVVKWLGVGNTKGDIVVHLPKERVVATGDLVVAPVPFGFGSFLADWSTTLRTLERLDVDKIVPGHGNVMTDWKYVDRLIAMFDGVWSDAKRAVANGADLEATRKAVNFAPYRDAFAGRDARLARSFDLVFATPIVEAAFGQLKPSVSADTIRVEVGSPLVDARVYKPHRARVRIHQDSANGVITNEWVNELTLGDSAGRPVMRWTTRSMIGPQKGSLLSQTYDGITMAPLGYLSEQTSGAFTQLRIEGKRVVGKRRTVADTTMRAVDVTLDRIGFIASASDLVPLAVGMRKGVVIVAPVWGPNMAAAESRIFSVIDRVRMSVEGSEVEAWKVEERRESDRTLLSTWYLTDRSPYMVAGETILANGRVQYATEIELPPH